LILLFPLSTFSLEIAKEIGQKVEEEEQENE